MKRIAVILLGVALIVGLTFLGRKVREFSDTEHERFQTDLWRLKQMDTAFNEDVLEARFSLLDNYDDFQIYGEEMGRIVQALSTPPAFINSAGRAAIELARLDYAELSRQRQQLFERFKSQNAMLSNSRRYLPVALDELAPRLEANELDRPLATLVNSLTRSILMRLSSPEELSAEAQESLQRIKEWGRQHLSHPEARFVLSLVRHAQTILTGSGEVDTLTRQLLTLPTAATIEKLFQSYELDVASALRRAQHYRTFFYLLSFIVLAGVGYTLWALRTANRRLERRVAERTRELARSEERFRTLCVASPIGIYMTDSDGRCSYTNPCCEQISGLSSQECLGDGWMRFVHPSDHDTVLAEWLAAAKAGREFAREFRGQTAKDGVRWVSSHAAPLRSADGQLAGFVGTIEDITERKRAEEQLDAAHKQLLETSRLAGMAEVATNVLHNVGNVLNSVNVSATLVSDRLKKSKVSNLDRAVRLLHQHEHELGNFITADPKGKQLPGYLGQVAANLVQEQSACLSELESLRKNIEHIKDIVAMQQSYAKISGLTETIQVAELVEDSLRMNAGSLTRHDVEVVRSFDKVAAITTEKHKVLQILVNLVRNAKSACDESGKVEKRIVARVENADRTVRISIVDNGVGIPSGNLERIFNHGYTTKKDGHGFGLHSGALAAKELGGSLSVHSEGEGRGATFTLELPLHPPERSTLSATQAPHLAA
ncbi:MAG: PAS domain S-box protein [Verrucomicrobiales bacterium]|nr:PAS domain S-box protein [Verrucomicrobiales bacterium]